MYIVVFIANLVLSIAPLIMLDVPFWAFILIYIGLQIVENIPFVGLIADLGLWTYVLVQTINGPQDGWAIFYYIAFGFMIIKVVLSLINTINKLRN